MLLEERAKPYTAEEVAILYPVLSEIECAMVARIEERFPGWHIWPHVDYPQTHIWLARKNWTAMQPVIAGQLGDLPGEITDWINQHSSPWGDC
jgi:hypothetical protein